MMSLFPADRPLSRTWSMVTQMAWETAKVSRPSSLLSFLLYSIPPPPTPPPPPPPPPQFLSSQLTQSPSSLGPPLPSSLLSPFSPPSVPPSQSSLSASSIHLSLSALILFCPPPAVSLVPPVNRVLCPLGQKTGLLLANVHVNTTQTFSDAQGKKRFCLRAVTGLI